MDKNPAPVDMLVYPIIYRLLYIPGGDRRISEPSAVWPFIGRKTHVYPVNDRCFFQPTLWDDVQCFNWNTEKKQYCKTPINSRDPITERQMMSKGCTITETKRKVFSGSIIYHSQVRFGDWIHREMVWNTWLMAWWLRDAFGWRPWLMA